MPTEASALLQRIGAGASLQLLQGAVRALRSLSGRDATVLLRGLGAASAWQLSLDFLQTMRARSSASSASSASLVHWNCGLSAMGWCTAIQLRQLQLELDTISFNTIIGNCEQGKKWTCALDVLAEMDHRAIGKDTGSRNIIMNVLDKCDRWREVLELPRESGDLVTYTILLRATGRLGWQEALSLLAEAQASQLRLDTGLGNSALSSQKDSWRAALATGDAFRALAKGGLPGFQTEAAGFRKTSSLAMRPSARVSRLFIG
ncbi:unnamed protein product [Effrenium voratum]|uniref:Pentatricopeptide repeat-containing protein n=1 Tax=Effrenium voratum TaxID=2562239 RepID=A0AA36MKX1_9DINO|nr:unnamed protein product [Effrenium voratum]